MIDSPVLLFSWPIEVRRRHGMLHKDSSKQTNTRENHSTMKTSCLNDGDDLLLDLGSRSLSYACDICSRIKNGGSPHMLPFKQDIHHKNPGVQVNTSQAGYTGACKHLQAMITVINRPFAR